MKKYIILFAVILGIQSFIYANPIDNTPVTIFSELVFDSNNNWTMEIYFPFGYANNYPRIDSIVFITSNGSARLKNTYPDGDSVALVTADSLTTPLSLNIHGDKIIIMTYSNYNGSIGIRQDSIIYGDVPGASVAAPLNGYSIFRYYTRLASNGYWRVDFLTKYPTLGKVNELNGQTATLTGHIYDRNNNPITDCVYSTAGQGMFLLKYLITINKDGTYTTPIFPINDTLTTIQVRIVDFEMFHTSLSIQPFILTNIHPDTTVMHDIYLTDSCVCCDLINAINNIEAPQNNELTLINYPNPFNLTTNFYVKVPDKFKNKTGSINIYNVTGQLIRKLGYKNQTTISWDAKDESGMIMPSGIYYYRLSVDKNILKTGSMILLK